MAKRFWFHYLLFCCIISSSNSIKLSILPANVTLYGDPVASTKNNTIILTQARNCSSSTAASVSGIGKAFYKNPIHFLDPSTRATTSFLCKFSFSITSPSRSCPYGDGFAFVITSNPDSFSRSEGFMGFPKQAGDYFVAVEFDTRSDSSPDHINGSLQSINFNTIKFLAAKSVDLRGGHNFTAWIEYQNSRALFRLWISNSSSFSRPDSHILAIDTDLSLQFNEFIHIGFSASNANGSAVYAIEKWDFETMGPPSSSRNEQQDFETKSSPSLSRNTRRDYLWYIVPIVSIFGLWIIMHIFGIVIPMCLSHLQQSHPSKELRSELEMDK